MGIIMTTPLSAIDQFLNDCAMILKECILTALAKLGEECVVRVRNRSAEESWIDHTGNLRSSTGDAVYDHGKKVIQSAFQQVLQGSKGSSEGQQMIDELASKYLQTYALVVVAGMNYAEKVEALESKDVLESTRIWAEAQVDSRIKTAIESALARIDRLKL